MSKQLVIAVMVVDSDSTEAKPEFYQNVVADLSNSTEALPQIQQWVSEQVVRAKLEVLKGATDGDN